MRIVAGRLRGRRLAAVGKGDARAHLRPTSDRVRESLFNVLAGLGVLQDARVLDLFAGTGAMGLEALSRGAEFATFVDDGRVAAGLIRQNVELTGTRDRTRLIQRDATRLGACPDHPATLVFCDPPYGRGLGAQAILRAQDGGWIAPGALVVSEDNTPTPPPEGFDIVDQRRYGDTHVTLMRAPDTVLT